MQRYEDIIRLYLEPKGLYRQPVDHLSRDQIKQHLREVGKERSPATVEAVHAVVSSIFEEAIDSGLLGSNPVKGLLKKILCQRRTNGI